MVYGITRKAIPQEVLTNLIPEMCSDIILFKIITTSLMGQWDNPLYIYQFSGNYQSNLFVGQFTDMWLSLLICQLINKASFLKLMCILLYF